MRMASTPNSKPGCTPVFAKFLYFTKTRFIWKKNPSNIIHKNNGLQQLLTKSNTRLFRVLKSVAVGIK